MIPETKEPRRLSFIPDKKCDVCGIADPSCRYTSKIFLDKFSGWVVCDSKSCGLIIEQWRESFIIPKEILIQKYGNRVTVKRTDNSFSSGWTISGDASSIRNEVWVPLSKDKQYKNVLSTNIMVEASV